MMDIYQDLLQWFIDFFDRKTSATRAGKFAGSGIRNDSMSDLQLADELNKLIIRKFKTRKVHPSFIDNI